MQVWNFRNSRPSVQIITALRLLSIQGCLLLVTLLAGLPAERAVVADVMGGREVRGVSGCEVRGVVARGVVRRGGGSTAGQAQIVGTHGWFHPPLACRLAKMWPPRKIKHGWQFLYMEKKTYKIYRHVISLELVIQKHITGTYQ